MTAMRAPCLSFAMALTVLMPTSVLAEEGNWISQGKILFDARLRLEQVDDDALADDASALTLRTRLGWQSAPLSGWYVLAEIEDVRALIEDYNSTANGEVTRPLVADPEGSEWNQAYLGWKDDGGNQFALGRQRLALDNHRFIGNVGWRQNEQTFDALSATWKLVEKLTLRYAYLDQAQRIFGNGHPNPLAAEQRLDTHLFNLAWTLPFGSLIGYGYLYDNEDLPTTSTETFGLRLAGTHALDDQRSWFYTAEYASQSDYAEAPDLGEVSYWLAEGGYAHRGHQFRLGFESLGSNGRRAVQTPLATLHAFNGWADRFLTTPGDGLDDLYAGVEGPLGPLKYAFRWHQYQANRGSAELGQELNLQLSWSFAPKWNALLKYAHFYAEEFSADVRKLWLSVEYRL